MWGGTDMVVSEGGRRSRGRGSFEAGELQAFGERKWIGQLEEDLVLRKRGSRSINSVC